MARETMDDLKPKVLKAALKKPLSAKELAVRMTEKNKDFYSAQGIGRALGQLVKSRKLLRIKTKPTTYTKN